MKFNVMLAICGAMCLVACGEPSETETLDASSGFDLDEVFDMNEPATDMSESVDMARPVVDMLEDLPSVLPDAGADLVTMSDMVQVEDMALSLDMPGDMVDDLDMLEDMAPSPDLDPGNYPPVTSAPLMGNGRPAEITIPASFDNTRQVPLVLALHGYGGNKDGVGRYFSLKRNVDARDFILVSPEGTTDALGSKFWNATDACCNGFNTPVDDAAYLRGLLEEAFARFNIDRGRVYVAGYSNGGFMAYRMACDSADYVTGIFNLAGGTYKDPTRCQPSQPVQILHLHGTADQTIGYNGGSAYPTAPMHPGAVETVTHWAGYNGCSTTPMMLDATEVNAVTVEEATVTGFANCPAQGQVELWTLPGAPHNPGLPQTIGDYILDRFFAIDRTP